MTPVPGQRPSILIADDHKIVGEGIAAALQPYFTVVGHVTELDRLIVAIMRAKPDVLILDMSFGPKSSLPVIAAGIAAGQVTCPFVVLTAHESQALERAAFRAGASAFLLKGTGTQDLRMAVEAALEGRQFGSGLPPARPRLRGEEVVVDGFHLSQRQAEILLLLHAGLSRQQAAERCGLGIRGIDFHVTKAKELTGIQNLKLLLTWVEEHKTALREGLE